MKNILKILYQPYKWLFYIPFLFINTIVFGLLAVIFSIIFNARIGSYVGGVLWSRVNASLVPMFVKVEGKEHIDPKKSYVILSNHQSAFDIFTLYGWLGIDIKWVMKKELYKIPGLGFGAKKVGHIFLDRSNTRAALESLNNARKQLVGGTSLIIFPEGTRSKTGAPGVFKRGAFKLALDLQLPILPVSLINTRKVMPAGSVDIFPAHVKMIIHKPINTSSYNSDNMSDLIQRVKSEICKPLPAI